MKNLMTRRNFVKFTSAVAAMTAVPAVSTKSVAAQPGSGMKLGLVTYLWGQDWDIPTLIKNCEETGLNGVELRTKHAHGVEPSLSKKEREEIKKRFAESSVVCLGYGSNQEYHSPDSIHLLKQIQDSFDLVKLCYDIGASGLKVKPNFLPEDVPVEKTIEQIGRSLNIVGQYAQDYDQEIRVEVHGTYTQSPKNMKAIFEHVTAPNVKICWNCNEQDLEDPGLKNNFDMLKGWFGETVHVRELNIGDYPYQELFDLFVAMDYKGWILLEARTKPEDRIAAMKEQHKIFEEMIKNAQSKLG